MIGNQTTVDVAVNLTKDRILKVSHDNFEFIPFQQSFANKTSLTFDNYPEFSGIYNIVDDEKTIKYISFNLAREESRLNYIDLNELRANTINDNVATLFQSIEKDNSIIELWKWFVILALAFLFIEVLIQKFLK
jgi:hypothetical protein